MIPLAQYFAETGSEDFKPLRSHKPERKSAVILQRPADALPKAVAAPTAMRPLKPMAVARPAAAPSAARAAPAAAPAEPTIGLREVEAERAAWQTEREAHARELKRAVDAARREGDAFGRAAVRIEMQGEFDVQIEDLRGQLAQTHADELATSRAAWTGEQSERLADLMVLQVAILEETIKVSLNNVLRPLALDARQRQTLDELVGAVRTMTLDGKAFRIAAAGPADLLSALETRLGTDARLMSFEPDESRTDLRIDVDNTVIETRLSSWHRALEEALS